MVRKVRHGCHVAVTFSVGKGKTIEIGTLEKLFFLGVTYRTLTYFNMDKCDAIYSINRM